MTKEQVTMELLKTKKEVYKLTTKINRVINKIKEEQKEFKSAENINMTLELGENYKQSLAYIFSVIEKEFTQDK